MDQLESKKAPARAGAFKGYFDVSDAAYARDGKKRSSNERAALGPFQVSRMIGRHHYSAAQSKLLPCVSNLTPLGAIVWGFRFVSFIAALLGTPTIFFR